MLLVLDVRASESALDLLGATDDERAEVVRTPADLTKRKVTPHEYILRTVKEKTRLVDDPSFELAYHAIVIAACSTGRVGLSKGRGGGRGRRPPRRQRSCLRGCSLEEARRRNL